MARNANARPDGATATATAPMPTDAPVATLASAQTEIAAMRRIVATLDALDPETRRRVLVWLGGRYAQDLEGSE